MLKALMTALRLFIVLTVATGVLYPLSVTLVARVFFEQRSRGSVVMRNSVAVGSLLLGQRFERAGYFWPRPSACDYGAVPSGASNQGPTSRALREAVIQRRARFLHAHPTATNAVPEELLCASGSGLDPHLSPEAAVAQIDRVAAARGLSETQKNQLRQLVERLVEPPQFGVFGCERVNVLRLNLALDQIN